MKLIILDRDGVINHDSEFYIKTPDEWIPIPGSLMAIKRLNDLGYRVVIATNQSGVARGLYDEAMLQKIHQKLKNELSKLSGCVDAIFYCPHHPNEQCKCRKPNPGLLWQIANKYQVSLDSVPFVGDSLKDLQAARQVNCEPILVLTGNGKTTQKLLTSEYKNVAIFNSLADYVASLK